MDINKEIKYSIKTGHPFSFGKMGLVEANHVFRYLSNQDVVGQDLLVNAGVYTPDLNSFRDWCKSYLNSVKELTGILGWCPGQLDIKILESMKLPSPYVFDSFEELEPFTSGENGWHYSLKGKTVLCVSPFPDTVRAQARRYSSIWKGAEIGQIVTAKSPYPSPLTGQSPTPWDKKLKLITDQIDKLDFDFATVGCGGLSLMVCSHIKSMGKPCVHLGGGNQILYDIRGKRWDGGFSKYDWYGTKHWIRPLEHEVPVGKNMVEGGCYW